MGSPFAEFPFKTLTVAEVSSAVKVLGSSVDPESIKLYADLLLGDLKDTTGFRFLYLKYFLVTTSNEPSIANSVVLANCIKNNYL